MGRTLKSVWPSSADYSQGAQAHKGTEWQRSARELQAELGCHAQRSFCHGHYLFCQVMRLRWILAWFWKARCLLSSHYKSLFPRSFLFSPFSLPNFDSDPGATTGVGPAFQQILNLGWHGPGGGACPCATRLAARSCFKVSLVTCKADSTKSLLPPWHIWWVAWEKSSKVSSELPKGEGYFIATLSWAP